MTRKILRNRKHYDPKKQVVCARSINTGGKSYGAGDPMNEVLAENVRAKFWATGRIVYADEFSPVKIAETPADESTLGDNDDIPADTEQEQVSDKAPVEDATGEVGETEEPDTRTETKVNEKPKTKTKRKSKG